jgi:hypothetical protein
MAVAMNEHPQTLKLTEVHDRPEVLRDVHRTRSGEIVEALAQQFFLDASHRSAEFLGDLFESSFEIKHDAKPAVRSRTTLRFRGGRGN